MAFKYKASTELVPESPEALLPDLRAPEKIRGILAHQADLIRAYVAHALESPDVALQLPTGSGKTLVGLLIGEWRRRKFKERIAYLCPTNQLVNQVADQAARMYGVKVRAFTGKKVSYDKVAASEYLNAETVAVTSYSAVFNVNPFFSDPQVLILDDAHSAENYIPAFWSVQVRRYLEAEQPLFAAIASILAAVLPALDHRKLLTDDEDRWDSNWLDKVPTPYFQQIVGELTDLLDATTADTDIGFRWSMIRDHLHACHLYVSPQEVLIRPVLPPSNRHRPFASAKQRIYMSATLGAGGELERITGRENIIRLPIPAGWDKQGIGRRYFTFPARSLDDTSVQDFAVRAIRSTGRALYLSPDGRTAAKARVWLAKSEIPLFDADDLEKSKQPFLACPRAVAIAVNRYDGIDLPGDECRLIVMDGVPRGTNLQERFFVNRLGAQTLLEDRIITRTVQGFGRCTRSPNDYAAILVVGDGLNAFFASPRSKKVFPSRDSGRDRVWNRAI